MVAPTSPDACLFPQATQREGFAVHGFRLAGSIGIAYDTAMKRIVMDTCVLVSGLRSSRGASHQILQKLGSGSFQIALSVPLILEYEAVLKREAPDLGLSIQDVEDVLDYLCSVADHRLIWYLWRPVSPDPADDMVLELAFEAEADAIVTFNLRHFFHYGWFHTAVVSPRDFLLGLEGSQ
jgi:predicted nucleic acid-binding protein